jgi:hypothetical protein
VDTADTATAGIDTMLAPLLTARDDLADRIGALAAIAAARIIRQEVPAAAFIDLAWTAEGDAAYMEPAGPLYDDAGTEITVPDQIRLDTRLQRYCALLDETNTGAWGDLVDECDASGRPYGEDVRRLDIAAALALPAPPALPALPAWIALLEAAVSDAGRPLSAEEAEQLASAAGHSTVPEALGEVLFAICGGPEPEED